MIRGDRLRHGYANDDSDDDCVNNDNDNDSSSNNNNRNHNHIHHDHDSLRPLPVRRGTSLFDDETWTGQEEGQNGITTTQRRRRARGGRQQPTMMEEQGGGGAAKQQQQEPQRHARIEEEYRQGGRQMRFHHRVGLVMATILFLIGVMDVFHPIYFFKSPSKNIGIGRTGGMLVTGTSSGDDSGNTDRKDDNNNNNNNNKKTTTVFRGQDQYWKPGVTQAVRTLWETPFARFQIHTIQLGGSDSNDNGTTTTKTTTTSTSTSTTSLTSKSTTTSTSSVIIDDWLWFDECDNVNVLVQSGDMFYIFEQTKYAIQGTTYAVLGGLIERDQDQNHPLLAAQRELKEELNMVATQWKSLGQYVAAANRGGGTTYVFWAQDARPIPIATTATDTTMTTTTTGIAYGELERQDVLRLSRKELFDALMDGKFREIKWTATVALALLQDASERQELVW